MADRRARGSGGGEGPGYTGAVDKASVGSKEALDIPGVAAEFGVVVQPEVASRLAAFVALFLNWNRSINLASLRSDDELITRHLVDSFALAALAQHVEAAVDVGSGGGLPAIPLALLLGATTFALFEPNRKKAAFLRTAVRELGLGGRVRIETQVVETAVAGALGGHFDLALSRATLAPPVWLALGLELVRAGGRVAVFAAGQSDAGMPAPEASRSYGEGRRLLLFRK